MGADSQSEPEAGSRIGNERSEQPRRPFLRRWKLVLLLTVVVGAGGLGWTVGRVGKASDPEQIFQRAYQAALRKDFQGVSAGIDALEKYPGFGEHVRLLRGARSLSLKNFYIALDQFARMPPEGKLREPTLVLTGECLYYLGELAHAERVFRWLARDFPDNPEAHRWLGAIYYDLGAMDHAIQKLNRLAELRPEEYQPHRLRGHILSDFEQFGDAIDSYQLALERQPPPHVEEEIARGLAKCLIREHRYQEALKTLQRLPDDASVLAARGECLWSLGRHDEARIALERAATLSPRESSVLLLKARLLIAEGQPEQAIAPLRQALKDNPHDTECRYQLALVYRNLKRSDDFEAEMEKYQSSLKLRERLTELNTLAISRPTDADLREQIASVCEQLGKWKLAEVWRQAASETRQMSASDSHQQTENGPQE